MLHKLILELPASISHHIHQRSVLGMIQHSSHQATSLQQQGKEYGTMEQHVEDNI
uniref:Uncharacterized protein n=1 Tax=Solanum lycopersicum TaxID=4081 RepID=A0A3Q7GVU2_SOLLC